MFRGVNALNLDAKGRMAIPTRYRQRLADSCHGQMVVTVDNSDRCLLVYPLNEWEVVERRIQKLPSFNKHTRRLQRLLIGHATDVELDGAGRLLVPPPLREFADLDKKAMLIGQGNRFELWSEDLWNQSRDTWLEQGGDMGDLPPDMETFSL
ncbi:division/cell wall cluster transcriptional repressor MraZ [Kaarinaea lacus]